MNGDKECFILESKSLGMFPWNRNPARELPAVLEKEQTCR